MPDGDGVTQMNFGLGALAGLKVIDLTRVLGGPYCTMILADHGAEVTKIEPPQGDETRSWGPPFAERGEGGRDASYFLGVNRNKRAMALDLRQPAAREVFLRLLEQADVLIENYKTGTLERWGLGYADSLSVRFPRLIHCRVSGFGAEGPLGGLPGYDAVVQAMTGLMSVNDQPGGNGMRLGTPVVDLSTGMYAAIGILMALYERQRSGQGQFIDMTLHDCAAALLHPQGANYLLAGKRPQPTGNAHPNIVPYDKWPTRSGDIYLAVGNDRQFGTLSKMLGHPQLADDPRFVTNADRMANREALRLILGDILQGLDGPPLADALLRAGVPAGMVQSVDEALHSEHMRARGMIVQTGSVRSIASPVKFSRTPAQVHSEPPRFAEHTDAILREHGYSAEEIAALTQTGAVCRVRGGMPD